MTTKRLINLEEIPQSNYEGYVWYSDEESPEKINGDLNIKTTKNPFIIEGLLWDNENKKSILIRHTGEYQIFQYDLKDETGLHEEKKYLSHRLEGIKKLKFRQVWEEENDDLCAGFPVLKLKAKVFIGFEK